MAVGSMFWMLLGFGERLRDDGAAGCASFHGPSGLSATATPMTKGSRCSRFAFLHGRVEVERCGRGLRRSVRRRRVRASTRQKTVSGRKDSGIVLPDAARRRLLWQKSLPLVHDEVVDVGRSFIAAGEDVERIANDDRRRVCRIVGAVGENWIAATVYGDRGWNSCGLRTGRRRRKQREATRWSGRRRLPDISEASRALSFQWF